MGAGFLFGVGTGRNGGLATLLVFSMPPNCTLSNVLSGKFYVLCILP